MISRFPTCWRLLLSLLLMWTVVETSAAPPRPPNVVLIYCDDLGWGDLGCFGNRRIRTPHIDRLARQGTRFTSFYVAQAVCSASRAALLTGCYANRLGIHGALGPKQKIGLHPDEMTLAEVLKPRGYATAIVGKWHLGRPVELLPTRQGFDEYFGLPYSNDMWPEN
ncbi:MAG: sulfatase-like hydrolase/transferase, partial [Verrucomicrobiota bacterium]